MKRTANVTRALSALCAAVALLGQLACGTPEQQSTTDLDAVHPDGQEVVFWYTHTGARETALRDLIERFNQTNPHDITVRGEHVGSHNQLYDEMSLGIDGGPLPQIVEAYRNQAVIYHDAGVIVDLTPYLRSARWGYTEDELRDFIPDFVQQDNVDGVQLALLPNRSMEVLYFNRDWLQELGFDGPPANWQTFASMCRAASAHPFSGGPGQGSVGILWERDASRLASIIFSLGGDIMNADRTAYAFDAPAAHRALQMMRDLVQAGAARLVADNDDLAAFAAGRALFAQRSSASAPQIAAATTAGAAFTWGVAGMPTDQAVPVENVYGASLAVVHGTPAQDLAAWLFIKWFTEPEQQDCWATASGYFPVRRSIAERLGSDFRVAYNLLQYGKPEPLVGGYEPVRALVVDMMYQVIEQNADIDAALAQLQRQANQTLAPRQ